ncbi:hypothetical protein [Rhizobium sp. LjRoot258]|uniref:hypothetical protein n=1 Tax=Rhizobium sp. LjRoot258 TaxID=3342299 RepID=UPI003ED0F994
MAKKIHVDLGEVSRVVILLSPTVVYLLLAGGVQEINAFRLGAKFKGISDSAIVQVAAAADLLVSEKEANKPRFTNEAIGRECRSYFVIRVGDFPRSSFSIDDQNRAVTAASAVRRSLLCGHFQGLVVIDERDRPLGRVKSSALQELISVRTDIVNSILVPGKAPLFDNAFTEVITTQFGRALTDSAFQAEKRLWRACCYSTQHLRSECIRAAWIG